MQSTLGIRADDTGRAVTGGTYKVVVVGGNVVVVVVLVVLVVVVLDEVVDRLEVLVGGESEDPPHEASSAVNANNAMKVPARLIVIAGPSHLSRQPAKDSRQACGQLGSSRTPLGMSPFPFIPRISRGRSVSAGFAEVQRTQKTLKQRT